MIVDGNDAGSDSSWSADLVIVGAGAAGIPAAAELSGAGLSVLLVESGGIRPTAAADRLSRGQTTDPRHGPLDRYRVRAFGGTTSVWGGRVAPLDPIDFEHRDYVPDSGWPIGVQELESAYQRAHEYLHAGIYEYRADACGLTGPRVTRDVPPFVSDSFHDQMLWRFSDPVDLGKEWHRKFASAVGVTVLLNTTVTRLNTDDTGVRVENCELRSLNGKRHTATGRVVVLAAGGLEVTRLLLHSRNDEQPAGLGNSGDSLGRYYTSHLAGLLGPFAWMSARRLPGGRYQRDGDGVYVRRTLSLRPETQRSRGLLNFRAALSLPSISDPTHESAVLSAAFLAKRFVLRRVPPEFDARYGRDGIAGVRRQHIRNVATHLPELVTFAPWWVAKRIVPRRKVPSMEANPGAAFFLHFDAEQTPLFESTVRLGGDTDPLGVPQLIVDWRVRDQDVESLTTTYELLRNDLAEAGIASATETRHEVAERVVRELGVGSHHIGTTRMAAAPKRGVVDTECRVHGVRNLYVASASVFPTAGVANPTLTITALAVRVARHIARELGRA